MTAAVFNTYFDGRILRLSVGENEPAVELTYSRPTDEGWSWASSKYFIRDGYLYNDNNSGGRDCDGGHQSGCMLRCPLTELEAGHVNEKGIKFPLWHHVENYPVWDQYAEMAGY